MSGFESEHDPFAGVPDVDERLAEWVDGCMGARDRERFEAELRVNPQLRQQVEEYEAMVAQVRAALNAPIEDVELADRVMATLATQASGGAPRSRPAWPLVWALTSAAALLVLVVWIDSWRGAPVTDDSARAPEGAPLQVDGADRSLTGETGAIAADSSEVQVSKLAGGDDEAEQSRNARPDAPKGVKQEEQLAAPGGGGGGEAGRAPQADGSPVEAPSAALLQDKRATQPTPNKAARGAPAPAGPTTGGPTTGGLDPGGPAGTGPATTGPATTRPAETSPTTSEPLTGSANGPAGAPRGGGRSRAQDLAEGPTESNPAQASPTPTTPKPGAVKKAPSDEGPAAEGSAGEQPSAARIGGHAPQRNVRARGAARGTRPATPRIAKATEPADVLALVTYESSGDRVRSERAKGGRSGPGSKSGSDDAAGGGGGEKSAGSGASDFFHLGSAGGRALDPEALRAWFDRESDSSRRPALTDELRSPEQLESVDHAPAFGSLRIVPVAPAV